MESKEERIRKIKFAIWANLQDNLRRGDILDRSRDENHKNLVLKNIKETEKEIAELRKELGELLNA